MFLPLVSLYTVALCTIAHATPVQTPAYELQYLSAEWFERTLHSAREVHPCAKPLMTNEQVLSGAQNLRLVIFNNNPYSIESMHVIATKVLLPDHVIDFATRITYELNPSVAPVERVSFASHDNNNTSWREAKLKQIQAYTNTITLLRAYVASHWMTNKTRQRHDLSVPMATVADVGKIGPYLNVNDESEYSLHQNTQSMFDNMHAHIVPQNEHEKIFHDKYVSLQRGYLQGFESIPRISNLESLVNNFQNNSPSLQKETLEHLQNFYRMTMLLGARPGMLTSDITPQGIALGSPLLEILAHWIQTAMGSQQKAAALIKSWQSEFATPAHREAALLLLEFWQDEHAAL